MFLPRDALWSHNALYCGADLSLWLDSSMFWALWLQSMSYHMSSPLPNFNLAVGCFKNY